VSDETTAAASAHGGTHAAVHTAADSLLRAGESILLIDRKARQYLRTLRSGARIHLHSGIIAADDLIGAPEGRQIENSGGDSFLVLRPTYAELIPHLPRRAQVIYPKDIGPILLWGDIAPGVRVLEVGTGPGALTIALLRAVGPSGAVTSYEIRPEFADIARQNVQQFFGDAPNWTLRVGDVHDGIVEHDLDRMIIDLAEPWTVLAAAYRALRPGAVLTMYVPTVIQVKQCVDQARVSGFAAVEVFETLHRPWHVQGLSIRPEHRMVAHTGFVVTARRLAVPGNASADAASDGARSEPRSEHDAGAARDDDER
jgi:tRNA (adenine57-N1/adenine58-N1)-methyltransferase